MFETTSWKSPQSPLPELVYGRNIISTSEKLATEAGIEMFRQGGNAIDAALAAATTLTVVEPCSNGIGGDGFAMLHHKGKLHCINSSGRSPELWTRRQFNQYDQMPELGWDSVTTPGVVSNWVEIHWQFGKLPFGKIFESAIRLAREGFPLSKPVAQAFKGAKSRYKDFPEFQKTFFPENFEPTEGAVFKNQAQADTLLSIAETRGDSFYCGHLASQIVKHSEETGGYFISKDLRQFHSDWTDPISINYRGYDIHELPPNGQGIVALIALGILKHFDLSSLNPDSANSVHLKIEAIKIAFAEAFAHVSDPAQTSPNISKLLEDDYLKQRADSISMDQAITPTFTPLEDHGTVCLSAADEHGTMISYIQSNYMGFGSGIVIPDTGICMQNRACGFNLTPGHPNEVGPAKRPFHTIIPSMVTKDGNPLFAFGLMGGHMQPQGHLQILNRLLDHDWNPQAISDAPRWYVSPKFEVTFESGFSENTIEDLKGRGNKCFENTNPGIWGGYQGIYKLDDGYCGGYDKRKNGSVGIYNS